MPLDPHVTFRNVDPSDAILGPIHHHIAKLAQRFAGIRACHVVFERAFHPLRDIDLFRVDLVLILPGGVEVAVSRDAPQAGREDPAAAVQAAFEIADRRIDHLLAVPASAKPSIE